MNNFRSAREFCFQFFFHLQLPVFASLKQELKEDNNLTNLRTSITDFKTSTNVLLDDKANEFVETQIVNTLKYYSEIEGIIEKNLKNWKISRLSKVDYTNLLLAVNELCYTKTAPMKVIINEAIEISKKFGSLESASFINGVLDSVAKSND